MLRAYLTLLYVVVHAHCCHGSCSRRCLCHVCVKSSSGQSGGSHPYPENRPLWTVVCCFRWRSEGVPTNSAEDAVKLKRNQVRVAGQRKFLSVGGSERNQSRIIFFFDFRISTLAAACACLPTGWRLACVAVALRPTLWVSGRTSLVSH